VQQEDHQAQLLPW